MLDMNPIFTACAGSFPSQPRGDEGPMLTISFYFLGLAAFIVAALFCFSRGKRAGKCGEVELDTLRAASICLPTGKRESTDTATIAMYKKMAWDEKIKLSDIKTIWLQWYERCKRRAIKRQKTMYSWARTLTVAALLCLVGVLLEAEFDQPITMRTILAGFRRPDAAAPGSRASQLVQPDRSQHTFHPASHRPARNPVNPPNRDR